MLTRFLSFLVIGAAVASAQPFHPRIASLTVSNTSSVTPGDTIMLNYTFTPGALPATSIQFDFSNGTYDIYFSPTATEIQNGVATTAVKSYWPNGNYKLRNISINDATGGPVFFDPSGNAGFNGTPWLITVPADPVDLHTLGFTITGASTSLVMPTITHWQITNSDPLIAGSPVTIQITDTFTGSSATAMAGINGPNSIFLYGQVQVTGNQSTISIPTSTLLPNGTYSIAWLNIADEVTSNGYSIGYGGAGTFQLTGATASPQAPVLNSVAQTTGTTIAVGGTVSVEINATAGSAPITAATVVFTGPGGAQVQLNSTDGVTSSITVGTYLPSGPYKLYSITLSNGGQSSTSYYRQGNSSTVTDSTGTHTVDVSGTGFTLTGGYNPFPTIEQQPVSSTLTAGQSAQLVALVHAPQNGSAQWYQGQSGDTSHPLDSTTFTDWYGRTTENVSPVTTTSYWVRFTTPGGTSDSNTATITVPAVTTPVLQISSNLYANVGEPFSYTVVSYNGPSVFSATNLPPGLSIDNNGVISGTPTTPGGYSAVVKATNSSGYMGVSTFFTVTGSSPSVAAAPTNQSATVGGTASFSVAATGSNPLSYQWTKDGTAIPGATSPTFTLSSVQTADAGDYGVSVTNTLGTVTAGPATLTVTAAPVAPTINMTPQDQTVFVGNSASFRATATGTGPLGYQWAKDNVTLPGATGATLVINPAKTSDAGIYTVTVSNSAGSASARAGALTVNPLPIAPTITVPPTNQSAVIGTSTTFTVTASGTPTLSYQWSKNGSIILGATSANFTIVNVQPSDAGNFSVTVSNSRGIVSSGSASLTVVPSPYAGAYFGSASDGGAWALYVNADNTGKLVYAPHDGSAAILSPVVVQADGSFGNVVPAGAASVRVRPLTVVTTVPVVTTPPGPPIIAGQITGTAVQATVGTGSGTTLTGTADRANGTNSAVAGIYSADAVGSSGASTYLIVGPSGEALVVIASSSGTQALTGSVTASGQLTATSSSTQLSGTISGGSHTLAVTETTGGANTEFTGLAAGAISTAHLANVSVRANSGPGEKVLTIGFVVAGDGAKQVLIRAVGPGLVPFGITGYLADPQLEVYTADRQLLASNDNWGTVAGIADVFKQVNAFDLPANSKDAAVVVNVAPGLYSAQATTAGGSGVALVEAFDVDGPTVARFSNFSVRSNAGSGEQTLTAGFVVTGDGPRKILIRGVGPTLSLFGVGGVLADPVLAVIHNKQTIATNDNWAGDAAVAAAAKSVSAFPLPVDSTDAAVVVTVEPGLYSAQLTAANNTAGVALIEVYELP